MSKKTLWVIIFVGVAMFLSGCGAAGQSFSQFATPKQDQGLVYVYRPSSVLGMGVYYDIHVTNPTNPDLIAGELVNGSYVEVDVPVGENEIWGRTESKTSVTLDVKNGETYCVKGGVGIGFFIGRPNFEIVDMQTCQTEIVGTNQNK